MTKTLFSEADQQRIVAAIKQAEKDTSGEIRVHIGHTTNGDPVLQRASAVFDRLEMEKTKDRNAVLIFIAEQDRQFAIWADAGINLVVPQGYWESTVDLMRSYFKANQMAEGVIKGIHMIGVKLKAFFPFQKDDVNEISDEISFD